ncbi:MAG: SH3 domain-containing protein [Anaerolineae bacterium]|nr:SH3 domain-containing protein [Anaerolineae bacterium]
MEEEQTPREPGSPEPSTMATYNGNGGTQSSPKRLLAVGIILIVSLLIAGLFLPPISLAQRLGRSSEPEEVVSEAPEATTAEGLTLVVPSGAAVNVAAVAVNEATADERTAAMAAALPADATVESDLYLLQPVEATAAEGSIQLDIPAGAGDVATLDLYGWEGGSWRFVPLATADDSTVTSAAATLPEAVALLRFEPPDPALLGAELLPGQELPAVLLPELAEVTAGTLTLQETGELDGAVVEVVDGPYRQYVRVTNTGVFVDQTSLAALLDDEAKRGEHMAELLEAVEGYDGLNLDYQGVAGGQEAAFAGFVAELAERLHDADKGLIVTLDAPAAAGTGGSYWTEAGSMADVVYMRMPLDPSAYGSSELADELVEWAIRQVPRQKLTLLFSANAVDVVGGSYQELANAIALGHFGELTLTDGEETIVPGTPVEVRLTGEASPLEWDGDSLMYKYSYEQAGQHHSVWLNNEAAVSQRLQVARPYAVRGVALRGLSDVSDGESYAAILQAFVAGDAAPEPPGATFLWTVESEDEDIVASESGEALSFRWDGSEEPGAYTISAHFTQGETQAELGRVAVTVEEEEEEVVEAEPTAEATAAAPEAEATATPAPLEPGDSEAIVNTPANFRTGPGVSYGAIRVLDMGTRLSLTGRNNAGDWLQVVPTNSPDEEGWVFASLLSINSSVSVNQLAVIEVAPPAGGAAGAAPPPVISNSGFELGGQAFGAPYGQMSYAGMTWIKRQHKWGPGNTGQEVAGMITEAHNAGFKILLSMPGPVRPSSIDFGAYTEFLRAVASLPDPPDAIEVWNEQNIDAEWPAGQISPAAYVQNMLAPGYQAIKGANPNIMVVSGAPAPTGFFGGGCGSGGCDDGAYMAGMAAAGAASYMDCIGIHYNEGILPPSQQSGDPRASSDHYTRYFWGMVNTYYNAFGGSRPLCFTELGYLTGEGYGALPGSFSWAGNVTVAQQAQWLAEATSLSANSGKVRLLIVWNIDSTTWGSDPQAGYAIIRPGGGCPACETLHQVMGR